MTTPEGADPSTGPVDEDQPVLLYLAALEEARAAPERFPDPESAAGALAGAGMVTGDDREGLEVQLAEETPGSRAHVRKLEDDFVQVAAGYGRRHGMTYEGWRQAGVAPEVLARAGIRPPGE